MGFFVEYTIMNHEIKTSISIPLVMDKKLEKLQITLLLKGVKISKSKILIICLKKFLLDSNLDLSVRDGATGYNREESEFQPLGVRWLVDDYNAFRARSHIRRTSLSYLFYLAFKKYCHIFLKIMHEKTVQKCANYFFHYHARGKSFYGMYETSIYDTRLLPDIDNPLSPSG